LRRKEAIRPKGPPEWGEGKRRSEV
jgi:hypothetical protein